MDIKSMWQERRRLAAQAGKIFATFSQAKRRQIFNALPNRLDDPSLAEYYALKEQIENIDIEIHKVKHPEYYQ